MDDRVESLPCCSHKLEKRVSSQLGGVKVARALNSSGTRGVARLAASDFYPPGSNPIPNQVTASDNVLVRSESVQFLVLLSKSL